MFLHILAIYCDKILTIFIAWNNLFQVVNTLIKTNASISERLFFKRNVPKPLI